MKATVFDAWGAGMQRRFSGDPIEWLRENVRLPHSARSSNFDPAIAPWLNDIIRRFSDGQTRQIAIRAPVGGGKTTLLELLVTWVVAEAPGGMLLVGQSDDTSKDFAETRLIPVLNACPPVAKLFPKDRHQKRKTSILFPHMPLFLAGANLSSLQEKSMRYVWMDEIWRYREGMIGEAVRRTHDRWNSVVIGISQGWDQGHEADAFFDAGDLNEWGSVCEACGKWHKMLWSSIRYDEAKTASGEWDWEALTASVRHVCPHCEHVTPDTTGGRRAMAERGRYERQECNPVAGAASFTWSALSVYWIPWSSLVIEWVKAQELKNRGDFSALRQFLQKRLAQVWREVSEAPAISLTASEYSRGDYSDGQPIDNEAARFLTVDRQRDHFWALCRAWRADGSSRLIWEGKLLTSESIRNLQQRLKVKDKLTFQDAQFFTGFVYDDCVRYGWTALHGSGYDGFTHGDGRQQVRRFFSPAKMAQAPNGGNARYIYWSNEGVKDELVRLRALGAPHWEFPHDVSDAGAEGYLSQINSEVKRDTVDKATKQVKMRYVKVRTHNHLWDCEAMQVAAAMMVGLLKGQVDT